MDKVDIAREIETINGLLLDLCYKLIGAEPETEQAEALDVVADAIMSLENYLYPDATVWSDEDLYLDDGE